MMRRAQLLTTALLVAQQSHVQAATVQRINDQKDRLILELTAAELADVEEDQLVVVETEDPRFVTTGTLKKLNPQKKTAVLVLGAADERFAKKQRLTFLSFFYNSIYSSRITLLGQYHQFNRSIAGGFGGYTYQVREKKAETETATFASDSVLSGYHVGADGYVLFHREYFGGAFGFERRSLSWQETLGSDNPDIFLPPDPSATVDVDYLKPAFWTHIQKGWRLSLHLNYLIVSAYNDLLETSHEWNFFAPVIALVNISREGEWGGWYRDRSEFESSTPITTTLGVATNLKLNAKIPAEVGLFYRKVSDPSFVWGGSIAYIFYERQLNDGAALRRKAWAEEKVKFDFGFESRLESGAKFEWIVAYSGATNPGSAVITEQDTNQLNVIFGYHRSIAEGLLLGGNIAIGGGYRVGNDEVIVAESEASKVQTTSYGSTITIFVQKDFNIGDDRAPRR